MRKLAVLGTLVALSSFGLAGAALAQEDGGAATNGGAATTSDTLASGTSPAAPDARVRQSCGTPFEP